MSMSYNFKPLSDEELEKSKLIPEGDYDFQVVKSNSKISSKGNPMAELTLNVWDKEGNEHTVFDYLVFSTVNLNIKKISNFCKSVGLEEQYRLGCIPEDLKGLSGKLSLSIQDEQEKKGGGFYPKKNVVSDYIKLDVVTNTTVTEGENFVSDDIPF